MVITQAWKVKGTLDCTKLKDRKSGTKHGGQHEWTTIVYRIRDARYGHLALNASNVRFVQ